MKDYRRRVITYECTTQNVEEQEICVGFAPGWNGECEHELCDRSCE